MFFYSYLLSCTCIYDYMYRICSVAQRRIACSKATRNNSAHVIVDIFLVSGLPNCLCEGELDSAAMTPSWHMPRETICNNLCLLITNSYCWGQLFVYLLAFFYCLCWFRCFNQEKSCVEWNNFKQEKSVWWFF